MTSNFVRFSVGDNVVVINVSKVEAYGTWKGKTFLQVGGEEYRVDEPFEDVDRIVHAALSEVQP